MLEGILNKCKADKEITDEEIEFLLTRTAEEDQEMIFKVAREVREKNFSNKVFLYGFVYFSTYCRNNCTFCFFRRENEGLPRYRKEKEEVVKTAVELKESGVHLIDLTTGEDPYYINNPDRFADIVKEVKETTGLPVMVSPGVMSEEGIKKVLDAGADWYALYQETHNRALFEKMRIEQSYSQRISAKLYARAVGLLIEEGLLVGVGDQVKDRIESFHNMRKLGASQVRVMTYVQQEGAPLPREEEQGYNRELMTIAVMRLLFPTALIPASLDVEGIEGLKTRLNAGANVVTSIIPPCEGYAGVANSTKDVNEGYRTVAGIQATLKECGLINATAKEYKQWVETRKKSI